MSGSGCGRGTAGAQRMRRPLRTGGTEGDRGAPGREHGELDRSENGHGHGHRSSSGAVSGGRALDDYAIQPSSVVAPAGEITLQATNGDAVPHDLLVVRLAVAGRLPTSGIRLDEADPRIGVLGRTPHLSPNASASVTTTLAPGSYVLVCSVPHHYVRDSMATTLTLTP